MQEEVRIVRCQNAKGQKNTPQKTIVCQEHIYTDYNISCL